MAKTNCGFENTPQTTGLELLIINGPTIKVDIGFDFKFRPDGDIPIPGIKDVSALVDTGATESCIDAFLASKLKLPIVDKRDISGVGGKHIVNMYLAQIHIPSLKYTIYGAFAGVNLKEGGQIHNALIGRTFLQNFVMEYNGKTGIVMLSSS